MIAYAKHRKYIPIRRQDGGKTMAQTKTNTKRQTFLNLSWLFYRLMPFVLGLLIGRVELYEGVLPFGTAFLMAAFLNNSKINAYMVLAGLLASLCIQIPSMQYVGYTFCVPCICASLCIILTILKVKLNRKLVCSITILAYLVSTLFFKLNLILAVLTSVIEASTCLIMIMVFDSAIKMVKGRRGRIILSDEEIISAAFVVLLCILGMGNIHIGNVYLRDIVAVFLSMGLCYLGGAGIGAAAGILLGFATVIGGGEVTFAANLGLCALVGGVFRKLKKPGVALSFILVNAIMTFYINGSSLVIIPLIDTVIATIAFVLVPKKAYLFVGRYIDANVRRDFEQKIHLKRFRDQTIGRLKEISAVFLNASHVFADATKAKMQHGNKINYMIAKIPEECCKNCMFTKGCWQTDFLNTYGVMQKLYSKYESGQTLTVRDLGKHLKKTCVRPEALLEAAKKVFYVFSTNNKWHNKVMESRAIVGEQLEGVSRVIASLGKDLEMDISFHQEMEEEIKEKLDRLGLRPKEVCVEKSGSYEAVHIKMKCCDGSMACKNKVQDIVSDTLGRPMRCQESICYAGGSKYCNLTYEEAKRFEVITGIAQTPKAGNKLCGDAHSFEGLKDGKYMLLLCDGMGSGEKAHRESCAAVTLMEDFYRAGFDHKTTLDAINKLLILSSNEEMFSTMDLCMLDLIHGNAKFTKIGAPHSYLFREGELQKIHAGALPLGILDEFEPAEQEIELQDGDVIVMFTDGISDLEEENDQLHFALTTCLKNNGVQVVADEILDSALKLCNGQARDDTTVMVTKIRKAV